MVLVAILIATALILVNAVYVAAEFAAVSVRQSRLRQMASDGHPFARWLLPRLGTPAALDRYIAACQIGITISSLGLGAYAQSTLAVWLTPQLASLGGLQPLAAQSTAAVIVLLVLTAAQVIFGELVPKSLALQYPTPTALYTLPAMVASLWIYRPFIHWLNGSGLLLLRLLGAPQQTHRHIHSPDEIELLIAESRDGGLLEPEEQQRLRRALRLGRRTARDLMIPQGRLTMLSDTASWDEVVRTVAASPFSRIPVFHETPDRIVGLVVVKDLVERYITEGPVPMSRLIRPVVRLTEGLAADAVVTELRTRRAHSAVVVDDSGRSTGLITIQDVLGELLGLRETVAAPATGAAR
jgi:CBS domain containing-hemolysin-like protein